MDIEKRQYCLLALPAHLRGAGDWSRLDQLLTSFRFINQKTAAFGAQAVIDDYVAVSDGHLLAVQEALRLAASTTTDAPAQLAGQLVGRLMGYDQRLAALVREAEQWDERPWLRPLTGSLTPPGGALWRTLRGHTDCVFALALTPDGRYAITGAGTITSGSTKRPDHTIRVWDLDTGEQVRVIHGHDQNVNAVAVTPDGTRILSGSEDSSVIVWDFATGTKLGALVGHAGSVTCLIALSDGERAISGSEDGSAKLWDLVGGSVIRTFVGHEGHVTGVAVTPDRTRLVTASADKTIKVWNLADGQLMRTLRGHTETVWSVAVMPESEFLVSSAGFIYGEPQDTTVKVWHLVTGYQLRTMGGHSSAVTSVAVSADGQQVLSGSADRTIRSWDLLEGKEIWSLEAHGDFVNAIAITKDGARLVSASSDLLVKIWDLHRIKPPKRDSNHTKRVETITVTPDGGHAITTSRDNTVKIWSLEPWRHRHTIHDLDVADLLVTPDNRSLVIIERNSALTIWDLMAGGRTHSLAGARDNRLFPRGRKLALSVGGRLLAAVDGGDSVKLWNLSKPEMVASYDSRQAEINCIGMSRIGSYVLMGSDAHSIRIWHPGDGSIVPLQRREIARPDSPVGTAPPNPTGEERRVLEVRITIAGDRAVTKLAGDIVEVWDLGSLQRQHVLSGHTRWVTGIEFTPDGGTLITSSRDHTAKVWNARTGNLLHTFTGHDDEVEALSLTPDGQIAVTGSDTDRRLIAWEVATGNTIATFTADAPLTCCATCPDGQTILAGDQFGGVHILRLEGSSP